MTRLDTDGILRFHDGAFPSHDRFASARNEIHIGPSERHQFTLSGPRESGEADGGGEYRVDISSSSMKLAQLFRCRDRLGACRNGGAEARLAGERSIQPHLTAQLSAAEQMAFRWWTVLGDRPSSSHLPYQASRVSAPSLDSLTEPSAGRMRFSIFDRYSATVEKRRVGSICLSHRSKSLPKVARRPVKLARLDISNKASERLGGVALTSNERPRDLNGLPCRRAVPGCHHPDRGGRSRIVPARCGRGVIFGRSIVREWV